MCLLEKHDNVNTVTVIIISIGTLEADSNLANYSYQSCRCLVL